MARVCVVLSGCGYLDGAEIHESVLTLYFLDRHGAEVACFAPDKAQADVVDHLTGKATEERRNVLVESARIARGRIQSIDRAKMADFDALVLPGGFGAAKNLSDFASRGADATVDPDVVRLVAEAVEARKPIVAICIAPAVVAAALGQAGASARLTIGHDAGTAKAIEALGCTHVVAPVQAAVVDEGMRVISTPAYMLGPGPKDVGAGIEQAIGKLMAMIAQPRL